MRKTGGNFLFHRLFGWKALFWASAWWLVAVLSSYLLWNNLPATPFVLFFPAAAIVTIRSGPWYGAATGGAALIFALLRSEHLLAIFPGCLTMVLGCLVIVWLISAVQKRNQFLSEQAELLERIAVGQSVELVLPALTESISRLNRTAKACVILADDSQRHLADCLTASLPLQFAASLRGLSIETDDVGTCATAIKEGREAACQDIVHSTEWSGLWRESCLEYGIRACHSFPVFSSAGKAVASFFMCYSRAHKSTRWERKLASFGVRLTTIVLERDRATKALAESEQRFRSLADTIPQIAWMANPDGQIFWLNQRWYQYTGSTAENDKSLDWERAQDPRMFPRISANYQLAIRSGVAWEDTFPLRQHDGKMRSHLFRAVPFRNQSGE
ncbi:MAG: PAS domain-containing protein, partial [Verrucomicrobia bacterium]|nr:PAS domain-containing protein [Verrucomicrobiota bacterium]